MGSQHCTDVPTLQGQLPALQEPGRCVYEMQGTGRERWGVGGKAIFIAAINIYLSLSDPFFLFPHLFSKADYWPVILGDAAGSCSTAVGTAAVPAPSCKALLSVTPKRASGFYTLLAGNQVVTSYCEMSMEGGGWELVWRQIGGNLRPEHDKYEFYSNYELRQQTDGTMEKVGPPAVGDYSSQTSAIAKR